MKNLLNEGMFYSGTSKKEFFEMIKEVDAATEYVKKKKAGLTLYNYIGEDENGENFVFERNGLKPLINKACAASSEVDFALREMINAKAPVVEYQGTYYFSNNRAIAEIANANSLHGAALMDPSPERNEYIEYLSGKKPLTLVVRKQGGYLKVMAVRTGQYEPIPLAKIESVLDAFLEAEEVGMYTVRLWTITQDEAAILVEFPDLVDEIAAKYPGLPAKYIPGIKFRNGTTGYSTLAAQMTYRKDGCDKTHFGDESAAKHFKGFSSDAFLRKMREDIWGKYTLMPEKLAKAATMPIAPDELDAYVEKVFKHIRLNKVFQKKDTETCGYLENIRKTVINTLIAKGTYTAYDVIDTIMDVPSAVQVPDAYTELLSEACDRAWTVIE